MRNSLVSVGIAAVAGLSSVMPVSAGPIEVCEVVGDYIPAGEEFLYQEPEPGYLDGQELGSRVNVRLGPGTEHEATAYGLVGDNVQVIGQAFSRECETWIKVRFPISEFEGWVHAEYIGLPYARGWWD